MVLGDSPEHRRARARRVALAAALVVLALGAACRLDTLFAVALTSEKGSDGGQPLSVLSAVDQEGADNDWNRYLAFYPAAGGYSGVFTFHAPVDVPASTVSTLYVAANYRGRPKSQQLWQFELWDARDSHWTVIGDNGAVPGDVWFTFQFQVDGDVTRFLVPNGDIILRYSTPSAIDSSKLDFLTVAMGSGGEPVPAPPSAMKTVFQGSYARDDDAQVDFVAGHDLHVIGVGPTKLQELRDANPSLTALYYSKVAGVHGPETRPPSGDPQWAAAVANNLLWKGASGQYVRNTTNGWYYINIQDPAKRSTWWNLQRGVLDPQLGYYDGIYFDNVTTITSDFEDLVTEPPVGYDEAQYYGGIYALLNAARTAYPGKKVIFNTYAGWETPGFRGLELLQVADGIFFEGFSYKVRAGLFDKARLLQQLADFAGIVRGGKSAVALDYGSATDQSRRVFSLACYLLVMNDRSLRMFTSPEVDSDVQQWPEDDLDIGAPLGDYTVTASGLLQRDFGGARVIVNPDDTHALSYAVGSTPSQKLAVSGGGAWPTTGTLSWQSISGSLSLPPMTALVVRNTPS